MWSPDFTSFLNPHERNLSAQRKNLSPANCIKADLGLDVNFRSASLRAALQGVTYSCWGERVSAHSSTLTLLYVHIKPARTLSIHSFAGVTARNNNSSPTDPGTGCIEFRASWLHAYICFVCSDINIKCPATCFQHRGGAEIHLWH